MACQGLLLSKLPQAHQPYPKRPQDKVAVGQGLPLRFPAGLLHTPCGVGATGRASLPADPGLQRQLVEPLVYEQSLLEQLGWYFCSLAVMCVEIPYRGGLLCSLLASGQGLPTILGHLPHFLSP